MDKVFQIEIYENFQSVLQQVICNLTYCPGKLVEVPIQLEQHELLAAEEDVRTIITNCYFDLTKVEEILSHKTWDTERLKYFLSLLEKEKSKILYAALIHHNSSFGETITRSDWRLKLVLGTSELDTVRYPLLQLVLATVDASGVKCNRMFELNKSMLLQTIQALEQIIES